MTTTTLITRRIINGRLGRAAAFGLLAIAAALCPAVEARAQWVANGTNINNTNAGNVGVGTAAPTAKLEVVGATGPASAGAAAPDAVRLVGGTGGTGDWYGGPGGMGGSLYLVGGVGGRASSGSNRATGGVGGTVHITGGTGGASPFVASGAGGNVVLNGGLAGETAPAGAYGNVILSNLRGNVGVGTATPAFKLDVTGQVRSASGGFVFPDGSVQTTAATTTGGAPSTLGAANVSSGQFGASIGGGNFGFPASVTMNSTIHALIDTGASNRFRVCGPNGACSLAGEYIGGRLRLSKDGSFLNAEAQVDPGMGGINAPGNAYVGGNVGVGTTAPAARLHVAGDIRVDGNISAKYQDVAEWVPSTQRLSAGTVVVVDAGGVNRVLASAAAYDTSVAGVVSVQPGIALGERGEGKVLVATTGRVRVKVDATRAPIRAGDLLVTSGVGGVAMRSEPVSVGGISMHRPGTIVGKALESLERGTGEILVLLSLQ